MGILSKIKKNTDDSNLKSDEKLSVKKTDAKSKKETTSKKASKLVETSHILIRPIISEKATEAERHGMYTFEAHVTATKVDIKRAVRDIYGIVPVRVNVMQSEGKTVRRGKIEGRRKDWKKAIVTLPKGKTIHIHEGV